MLDEMARVSRYVEVHLIYASIVWIAAWVLTSIRPGSVTAKYWIWVATSINFVLPLSIVLDGIRPSHHSWIKALDVIGSASNGISTGIAPPAAVIWIVWFLGALVMFTRLGLRIRTDRRHGRAAAAQSADDMRPNFLTYGIPVRFVGGRQAPAVDGVWRPQISLPSGIGRLLTQEELDAVLTHELTHARRGDNFIRLVHEVALCALWFHPLVWVTGSRLAIYRELSCDESVIQKAHGRDLVSALAKLAGGQDAFLLQATASSFLSRRLARLASAQPRRTGLGSNVFLTAVFGVVFLVGVLATAARTAGISKLAFVANAPCPPNERIVGTPTVSKRKNPSPSDRGTPDRVSRSASSGR